MSIKVKKGDWIKLINGDGYYLLTDGKSYMVEEDPDDTKSIIVFSYKKPGVVIKNDLNDLGTYLLDRFELDLVKSRNEFIDSILI